MRENRKTLKQKINIIKKQITKSINEFDPCSLISSGAPIDEYDCLTDKLIQMLFDKKNKEEMKKNILSELENHFGSTNIENLDSQNRVLFLNDLDKFINNIYSIDRSGFEV
jgi:hypothetical protein